MKIGHEEWVRDRWIAASEFMELSEREVLGECARRVSLVKDGRALVLLDLDSTLYEVGPRTARILREWAETKEAAAYPDVLAAIARMEIQHVGYSMRDTFRALGLDEHAPGVAPAFEAAKNFWVPRFFSSDYLKHDVAYPGAVRFAKDLHDLGAELIYLTGRDEPGMGAGTRQRLLEDGFPWEKERTHLLLKADFNADDLAHKRGAAEYVRKLGTLVASFENEPKNLVALYEIFPEAMHVFVDTVCSDHAANAYRGLYRIKGFEGS